MNEPRPHFSASVYIRNIPGIYILDGVRLPCLFFVVGVVFFVCGIELVGPELFSSPGGLEILQNIFCVECCMRARNLGA